MNLNDMYPSKYLKAADIEAEDDFIVTIERVLMAEVGEEQTPKPVVEFVDVQKGLVLNVTNANAIAGLYGPDTDKWVGKKIALYSTEVEYRGKQTLAIRVRLKAPKA